MDQILPLQRLQQELGREWPAISKASGHAHATRAQLRDLLANLDTDDTSIVVFGSLAREEFTAGSDVDWTLLIDGQADPQHLRMVHEIAQRLETKGFKKPGREGVFGKMAFSHHIVHQIGGEDDTNRNTTERILLLLESKPIGRREAYDRVRRSVFKIGRAHV